MLVVVMTTSESTTRLQDYIKELLPWSHGHQLKSIATFVAAILEKQTGNQAELARTQGNQEAAVKRLSRLIHNERLNPKDFPEWLCRKALERLPRTGKVRIAIDWTTEDDQHLLVVSVIIGRRAMPIFWRAYEQSVLKGRMKRYELAVIKRAFKLIFQFVKPSRVRLTADRGFPDDDLFALLDDLKVKYIIRVKGSVKVLYRQAWAKLNTLRFEGNARRRSLGRVEYCQSSPRRLWVTISRARDKKGKWGIWYLVSNLPLRAEQAANEYAFRFDCEEGFRDLKWDLGFSESRVKQIDAWSRLFALFAIALMAVTALGMRLLVRGGAQANELLRRVTSRRRDRCELSLIAAVIALVQQDKTLFAALSAQTKFKLDYVL